jgi:hypothetical protein
VTLTNGGTSLIDAIGFAWEAFNSGLFQRCIVGAVEKIPNFLKPLAAPALDPVEWREGACLFLGSGVENGDFLFKVEDYFAVQLKPDFSLPKGFLNRFERLFDGVEWLGVPGKTPLEAKFPANLVRYSPNPSVMELGLSGFKALEFFLSGSQLCGIIAAFSKPERKFSFIKISKKGSRQNADVRN